MSDARTDLGSLVRASPESPVRARIWGSWCAHSRNRSFAHGFGFPGARIAEIARPRTDLAFLVRASLILIIINPGGGRLASRGRVASNPGGGR